MKPKWQIEIEKFDKEVARSDKEYNRRKVSFEKVDIDSLKDTWSTQEYPGR